MLIDVGGAVWYWPGPEDPVHCASGAKLAATVAAVEEGGRVTLFVIDGMGRGQSRTGVVFHAEGDPPTKSYCGLPVVRLAGTQAEDPEKRVAGDVATPDIPFAMSGVPHQTPSHGPPPDAAAQPKGKLRK